MRAIGSHATQCGKVARLPTTLTSKARVWGLPSGLTDRGGFDSIFSEYCVSWLRGKKVSGRFCSVFSRHISAVPLPHPAEGQRLVKRGMNVDDL